MCTGKFEYLRIFDNICMQICLQICMHIGEPTSYIYVSNLYHILKGIKSFLYEMIDIAGLCPDSRCGHWLQDVVKITYIS